jgi:hypothetical protein
MSTENLIATKTDCTGNGNLTTMLKELIKIN